MKYLRQVTLHYCVLYGPAFAALKSRRSDTHSLLTGGGMEQTDIVCPYIAEKQNAKIH
jgi:hypothetical protein